MVIGVDTNIILIDSKSILNLTEEGDTIILSQTVLQEVDNFKSKMSEIGYQAREFGRMLNKTTYVSSDTSGDVLTITLELQGRKLKVVSHKDYKLDRSSSSYNDEKIIKDNLYFNSKFYTNDTLCRILAIASGLEAEQVKEVEKISYDFFKTIEIDNQETFRKLHNTPIKDIDSEYEIENYSYKFIDTTSGQAKLASIVNETISIIGKDTEDKIRRQNCAPIGGEQLLASKSILDPSIDLTVIEGKAGSGKNIVAVSSAMKLMDTERDKYTKLIYLRNPVDDVGNPDEEIGFLSTNEGKKEVYLGALEDTLQFIVRNKIKKKNSETTSEYEGRVLKELEKILDRYQIESLITLGLRGRTFTNAVVILDEWQNAGSATSQKVLTRIGENCKVIVIGSLNQIDSKYLTKFNNGLSILMQEASKRSVDSNINMFAINLVKAKRSAMCDFAEKTFEKIRN